MCWCQGKVIKVSDGNIIVKPHCLRVCYPKGAAVVFTGMLMKTTMRMKMKHLKGFFNQNEMRKGNIVLGHGNLI